MCCKHFVIFYFIKIILCDESDDFADFSELNCKDNDNYNVDWWYIYKPPSDELPIYKLGHDFVYITSYRAGRWVHSGRHITSNSMLQRTLAPLNRATSDSLAVVAYEGRKPEGLKHGSSSFGLLMANDFGGLWISHTVPGLIDLRQGHASFPRDEIANGHLLMCLSLDLFTLNQMGLLIQAISPRFTEIQIPARLRTYLPDWNFHKNGGSEFPRPVSVPKILNIVPKKKSMEIMMLIRKPGDKFCPYARFAKKMNVVLDIYGHHEHNMPYCFANYSIRTIEGISMKSVEYVHYVPRERDKMSFAVTTAGHWQRIGASGKDQYWTCVGPADDYSEYGAILMCVDRYEIWQSFDNFKVKEPVC